MPALAIHGLRNETVYPGIAKAMPGSFYCENPYRGNVYERLSEERHRGARSSVCRPGNRAYLRTGRGKQEKVRSKQFYQGKKGVTVAAFVGGRMRAYDYHANPGGRHCVWREPRQAVHGRKSGFYRMCGYPGRNRPIRRHYGGNGGAQRKSL